MRRESQHSAGLACVVAIRHPQVFSFPSMGIAGHLPALGRCAPRFHAGGGRRSWVWRRWSGGCSSNAWAKVDVLYGWRGAHPERRWVSPRRQITGP